MKRTVEIFTAGCPVCYPVVKLVQQTASQNCEITVYDLIRQSEDKRCLDKVKTYGITNIPSVVVNGNPLDCCNNKITRADLVKAGMGQSV